jgi:hypothetical protein
VPELLVAYTHTLRSKLAIPFFSQDGSGTIDFEEFLQMMTSKMGERDSREEIIKAFKLFDDDNTGFITLKNLKRVAKELGENLTDEELQVGCVCLCVCAHGSKREREREAWFEERERERERRAQ